jgi:hypothetical protein
LIESNYEQIFESATVKKFSLDISSTFLVSWIVEKKTALFHKNEKNLLFMRTTYEASAFSLLP